METIQKTKQEKAVSTNSDKAKEVENMETTFKELSEMTNQEIQKLGKGTVILRKVFYKKSKRTGYEILVQLHELLTIRKTFEKESEYHVLALQLNLNPAFAEHTLKVPMRFVTGTNINGNKYHQIEVALADDVFYGDLWLNGSDYKLFTMVLPNAKFVERQKAISNINLENIYYQE